MNPREGADRPDGRVAAMSLGQEGRLVVEGTGPPRLAPFFSYLCLASNEGFDQPAVVTAMNEVVCRHESLRTSFEVFDRKVGADEWPGGRHLQRRGWTSSNIALDVEVIQPDGDGAVDSETAARRAASLECARPFSLDERPLLRVRIIRSYGRRQLLLMVASHLIVDRVSLMIVREEFTARYRRLRGTDAVAKAASPPQHTNFVNWQRARVDSSAWRASLIYWRKQWRKYGPSQLDVADLPGGRPSPAANRAGPVDQLTTTLDAATVRRLVACAALQGATIHALLLAIFAWTLLSFSRKRSLALWGNFANRSGPHMNEVVGWLANSHLIGFDASSAMTIEQLVKIVKRALEVAARHEDVPTAYLWKTFAKEAPEAPSPADSALWVAFDSVRLRDDPALGWEQLLLVPSASLTRFDLFAVFARQELSLVLSYSRDRFDRDAVANLFAAITRTLHSLLTNHVVGATVTADRR